MHKIRGKFLKENRIFSLVLKDLRTFRTTILLGILPSLLISSFMVTIVDTESWVPYIAIGCAAVSFLLGYCFLYEKFRKIEVLTCSLPVTRSSILFARYITAATITIFGIGIWSLAAVFLYLTISSAPDNFFWFLNPYTWFIILLYFSILISFLMPIFAGLDRIILIALILFVCTYILVEVFHYLLPLIKSNSSIFNLQNLILLIVLSIIIILSPFISLNISAKIFNNRDL